MTKRVRILEIELVATTAIDDGETLTKGQLGPITITGADWATFPERLAADLADIEAKLNDKPTNSAFAEETQKET